MREPAAVSLLRASLLSIYRVFAVVYFVLLYRYYGPKKSSPTRTNPDGIKAQLGPTRTKPDGIKARPESSPTVLIPIHRLRYIIYKYKFI